MQAIRASENISLLVPEDDTQELWQLTGRIEALRDYLICKRSSTLSTVYIDEILAIIGCSEK